MLRGDVQGDETDLVGPGPCDVAGIQRVDDGFDRGGSGGGAQVAQRRIGRAPQVGGEVGAIDDHFDLPAVPAAARTGTTGGA